ncbi:hypothetical protein HU200_016021 [Digitaria exilis]|uniref:F-box associated domain-containing protein n=1 Tax=Digitaria exilis TaxID=1010633 RepID=A0A835F948_9POAL|nr:hypothetical protein HU200_016021 [Digitaria exilis]
MRLSEVQTYSSESRVWSKRATEWGAHGRINSRLGSAFVDGMLHFMVNNNSAFDFAFGKDDQIVAVDFAFGKDDPIVAVDREGKRCRNIRWAEERGYTSFVGQSQGRLHCISGLINSTVEVSELSVWALEEYDREEWVLKHSVSFAHLSGNLSGEGVFNFYTVAIHPDCNMLFFVQRESRKLIVVSYNMDSKELCVLCSIGWDDKYVTQYVPYFS